MNRKFQVGAYYFPNYHLDPRNEAVHGSGWTEWELVKRAMPRFAGHDQPKVPLWGFEDEADPQVMARKIEMAAAHGLSHWIFDWYWYDDAPFLARALDEGFLGAPNNAQLKFALMWANHTWTDIHPAKRGGQNPVQFEGAATREMFDEIVEYVIERYFRHPSYWKIEGCPYFSIYELMTLVRGLGGLSGTRAALEHFRARTRAAGFPDLHLNAVVWGVQILPDEQSISNPNELLGAFNFNSVSSYVWLHHVSPPHFPSTAYELVAQEAKRHWHQARRELELPFHPNVTMGWDASPRTVQSDTFDNSGYPFMTTLSLNTPAHFEAALREAKGFLEEADGPRILSVNAWNEWTEGSYLEPDTVHGMGYLEAIANVFGGED